MQLVSNDARALREYTEETYGVEKEIPVFGATLVQVLRVNFFRSGRCYVGHTVNRKVDLHVVSKKKSSCNGNPVIQSLAIYFTGRCPGGNGSCSCHGTGSVEYEVFLSPPC